MRLISLRVATIIAILAPLALAAVVPRPFQEPEQTEPERTGTEIREVSIIEDDTEIKDDEEVLFFATYTQSTGSGAMSAEIHGWIYEPEKDSALRELLFSLVRRELDLESLGKEAEARFLVRGRWFLVDNERGKKLSIQVGEQVFELEKSGSNGHFFGRIFLPEEVVSNMAHDRKGRLEFRAVTRAEDKREFLGHIYPASSNGLAVISDIDDTIKISDVNDKSELLANTFTREFQAVTGMAAIYRHLKRIGASFHYVSAGPWPLYEPLNQFIEGHGFPLGPIHLRDLRIKDASFYKFMFEDALAYKEQTLAGIMNGLPDHRFILFGDSGEQDPEVYVAIAKQYPGRIIAVAIRDVQAPNQDPDRFQKIAEALKPVHFATFRQTHELLTHDWMRNLFR